MILRKFRYTPLLLLFMMLVIASCSEVKQIIKKETPREKYISQLQKANLLETEIGQKWIFAGENAINIPLTVDLPYREQGYFFANTPEAHGYIFEAKRGEKISIYLQQKETSFVVFMDLYIHKDTNEIERVSSAGEDFTIEQEAKGSNNYLLRIQPELLSGGSFELTIELKPSLAFPVAGYSASHIQSFWHAPRDGGNRKHEGVDVFAPKGTPVVAVEGGLVTRSGTNRLGGNVVFVKSKNKSLYFAHLDSQNVTAGQIVKVGDTLGFVGNTGNALHTKPHLHFGIYTLGGAVDPFPFINNKRPEPPSVKVAADKIGTWARTKSKNIIYSGPGKKFKIVSTISTNTPFTITGGTDNWMKIRLFDGSNGFISSANTELLHKTISNITAQPGKLLKTAPAGDAAIVHTIHETTILAALGEAENHWMVSFRDQFVWLEK